MREIKFRAWHKLSKEMLYEGWTIKESGSEIYSSKTTFFMLGESAELMQYTGLKDKNGKEIYEGDICQYYNRSGKIIYDNKRAAFCLYTETDDVYVQLLNTAIVDIEIIGNIYENPELLK